MIETKDGDMLLTPAEAEKQIEHELSAVHIAALARNDRIKSMQLRSSTLISWRSLQEYLKSGRKPGPRRKDPDSEN